MTWPIPAYPDPNKSYTLFTDASKYAWSAVLTQEQHSFVIDGKTIKQQHPITYTSGLFQGSQLNQATLTQEAYATCMAVKKLFFLCTRYCDHIKK